MSGVSQTGPQLQARIQRCPDAARTPGQRQESDQMRPIATIASATLRKPARFAPAT